MAKNGTVDINIQVFGWPSLELTDIKREIKSGVARAAEAFEAENAPPLVCPDDNMLMGILNGPVANRESTDLSKYVPHYSNVHVEYENGWVAILCYKRGRLNYVDEIRVPDGRTWGFKPTRFEVERGILPFGDALFDKREFPGLVNFDILNGL